MTRLIAGLLLGAIFVVFMIYTTLGESRAECEVCVDFGGHRACRTASAADRESAVRGAIASACAVLSSGVTQGIRCDQTPPRSVRCAD